MVFVDEEVSMVSLMDVVGDDGRIGGVDDSDDVVVDSSMVTIGPTVVLLLWYQLYR